MWGLNPSFKVVDANIGIKAVTDPGDRAASASVG